MPSTSLPIAAAALLLPLLAAPLPTEQVSVLGSGDETGADSFGASVAIDARRVIVGAPAGETSVGSALIFRISNRPPLVEDTLTPDDAPEGSEFGASVNIDAAYAVVGAPGDDDEADNAGAAYIFKRAGSDWSEVIKLTHPAPAANDEFGASVAIDAKLAVIGAPGDGGLQPDAGSVHLFARRGADWQFAATISTGVGESSFGASVAIDGERIIVGAPADGGTGAAYIYRKRRNQWQLEDQLLAKDRDADDAFGTSVAIDGKFAVVGAPGDDEGGDGAGAVYFFERGPSGQWALVDKRRDASATVGALGASVALSAKLALAGTPEFPADGPDSGAAHPFRRDLDAQWPQATNALRPAKPGEDFRAGASVALDQGLAAVAAPGANVVFIFR